MSSANASATSKQADDRDFGVLDRNSLSSEDLRLENNPSKASFIDQDHSNSRPQETAQMSSMFVAKCIVKGETEKALPTTFEVCKEHDIDTTNVTFCYSADDISNSPHNSYEDLKAPLEGGYGWVCCVCVTLIMFSTWGANSAFGVFLAYFFNNGVFLHATKFDYALIAGMTVAFGQGLAPLAMVLTRILGCKMPMYAGIVVLFLGFFLASFATKLWHLYVTQGVLVGISIALLYAPATTIIPGWFFKKRSLAIGVSLMGTGAGGVTYSLAVNKLIGETGHHYWALRMMAIVCSITLVVSVTLLKERNPSTPTGLSSLSKVRQQFEIVYSLQVSKMPNVLLLAVWFAFALFAYNLMIFTLSPYGVAKGLNSKQASLLTTSLNASQCLGRPVMGFLGDRIGKLNVTVILTTCLTVFMFAFWLNCHSFLQLLFFSICVGSCVGVANVMSTVLVADMVNVDYFLPAWSLVNAAGAPFLLVCEVVAQALVVERPTQNPYLHTQVFAGLCFSAALLLIMLLREFKVRKVLQEGLKTTEFEIEDCLKGARGDRNLELKNFVEEQELLGNLLTRGAKGFLRRMFYPVKV
ncbi:LAMI_0G17854g1_1 [Lachancea mirantina]|uniref:LAMI_0G17854g1_1 n=1 Tax=Lachancea mirantina TaxID=1230905 RepID=A0A1G4KCY2_9SACH|nr:LAMI_0G17854g1_1 [Lachancea mirantina]